MKRFCTALLAMILGSHVMAADIEEPNWALVDTLDEVELRG